MGWRVNIFCPRGHLQVAELRQVEGLQRAEVILPTCDGCAVGKSNREPTRGELRRLRRQVRRMEKGK